MTDQEILDAVNVVMDEEVTPALASHGGMVRLVEVTEQKEVILQLGGGCQSCGMADVTLAEGEASPAMQLLQGENSPTDINSNVDGRFAFFVNGKFGTHWKLTASADTREGPIDELFSNWTVSNMFGEAARGKMSCSEALRAADAEVRRVFDHWRRAGKV